MPFCVVKNRTLSFLILNLFFNFKFNWVFRGGGRGPQWPGRGGKKGGPPNGEFGPARQEGGGPAQNGSFWAPPWPGPEKEPWNPQKGTPKKAPKVVLVG